MTRYRLAAGLVLGFVAALSLSALAAVSTKDLLPALSDLATVALPTVGSEGYLSTRVSPDSGPTLVRVLGGLGDSQKTAVTNATATGTVAIDLTLGTYRRLTETGNVTIGAPSGGQLGQVVCFQITQGGAGGFTTTWNAAYHGPTWSETTNTTGKVSSECFIVSNTSGPVLEAVSNQVAYH